jgi:O-antigen ligase
MNREVMDRWCERGILGLVLAMLAFGPLALGAVRTREFLVIQGLTVGVMILWGVRLWLAERPRLLWPPVCWAVALFAAYAVVRYLTCDIEYAGRLELIHILIYTFVFFAILNNLHRQESTQIISFALIFLAMAIAGYAAYQFLSGSNRVWWFPALYKGRASGTYMSPNHLGGFLEMLLPLALAYTLVGRGQALTKVLLGYAALVIAAGIGVTLSRGSWVSAGFALVCLFGVLAWHRNYRLPALVMLAFLLVACAALVSKSPYVTRRVKAGVESGKNPETDMRLALWQATARMWRDHPWFGVGPGHFDYRFRAYRPAEVQLRPDRAHNEYLNTLADWGVVGAALVAAGLATLFAGVARTWKHVRRPENDFKSTQSNKFACVLGATLGLTALLVHSLVDFNLHIPANALLAASLAAMLAGHWRFATDHGWWRVGRGLKILASLLLAGGAVYLGWQAERLGREQFWLARAGAARVRTGLYYTPEELAAREKAFAVEPANFDNIHAIGEARRLQSFAGGADYRELAEQAMTWFARGTNANPYDGYNFLSYGMCLDWLDQHPQAEPYFNRADELDPNGYTTAAYVGWHYVQTEQWAAARPWFERSLRLQWRTNQIAATYLQIVNRRLLEAATERAPAPAR